MPCTQPLALPSLSLRLYRKGLLNSRLVPFPLSDPSSSRDPNLCSSSSLTLLSCGKCTFCLKRRSDHWAARCTHEASTSGPSCFITLTYDNVHLPDDYQLRHSDIQKFMKRLRFHLGRKTRVRFVCTGEYGSSGSRPHYHLIIFGFDFSEDRTYFCTRKGGTLYRSAFLERLWPFGYSSVGELSFKSARYVAKYSLKRRFSQLSVKLARSLGLRPEYIVCSNGIGFEWLKKYYRDIFRTGRVRLGLKGFTSIPRYYIKKLVDIDKKVYDDYITAREQYVDALPDVTISNSHEHLAKLQAFDENLASRLVGFFHKRSFDYVAQNLRCQGPSIR